MLGAAKGQATVVVDAPPERVYELVSDVTRMGDWSPECKSAMWLEGATGPAVGAKFRGNNHLGPRRWSTICTVTEAEPGREFAFTVMVWGREATRWRYTFRPHRSGAEVTESFDYVWAPWPFMIGNVILFRGAQLRRGLRLTLSRLKAAAEAL
jgi:uncharacterized protein YndB with AHSA1/START domain